MNYKIAIPSYKRQNTLVKKTLKYLLEDCKIDPDLIYVFVANLDEYINYKKAIKQPVHIVNGTETLMGQRNFIQNHFPEGTYVINFDDDVDGLFYAKDKKLHLLTDLEPLFDTGLKMMIEKKTKLFGVYPVANHFFMDERTTDDLRYIVGCFWGCIADHDPALNVELEDKEDFERTIKYFIKFKKVLRVNSVCVKTNYYKEPGGMQVTRTKQRVADSADFLAKKYPAHCLHNTGKKDKEFAEVKLHYNPSKEIQKNLF